MGSGNFNVTTYKKQADEAKVSKNSGFAATSMCDEFNPAKVETRFSKRGPFNEFRDVITVLIGLDVTGSMGTIPKSLLAGKLGSLMIDLKKTFNRPNENLQISFAGIGDAKTDKAPLQVTHFESDNRFAQQLQKIWLEGGGGGNGGESYNLLWWYAANKTRLNYVKQDNRKGILITIGDDNVHPSLTSGEIQKCLDPDAKHNGVDISNQVLLEAAREQYDIYHIVIKDGSAYKYDYVKNKEKTQEQIRAEAKQWTDMLGQENVITSEIDTVANTIAEIIKRHRPLERANMINLPEEEWVKRNKETLTDEQWEEVLSYALCPVSGKFMKNPMESGGKRACEKEALENYVKEHKKDPITQKNLTSSELVLKPNLNISQLCSNYRPFFDILPDDRKERLVKSTFDKIGIKTKEIDKNNNISFPFFASNNNDAEQAKKKVDDIKLTLECSITHKIMKDPVMVAATGQSYERSAIEAWFKDHDIDPNTKVKLEEKDKKNLIPNFALKAACDQARANKKQLKM